MVRIHQGASNQSESSNDGWGFTEVVESSILIGEGQPYSLKISCIHLRSKGRPAHRSELRRGPGRGTLPTPQHAHHKHRHRQPPQESNPRQSRIHGNAPELAIRKGSTRGRERLGSNVVIAGLEKPMHQKII
jgi:hypothetical protein